MASKSIKVNFIYNTCYQVLAILIPFITTPYISRVLGPERIGEYSYAYSIANYFVLFAMLGLNNYGNRTIAGVRDDSSMLSKKFCEIYALQVVTSASSLFVYLGYVLFLGKNDPLATLMILYVLSAGFDINWLFFGLEEFKLITIRNAAIKLGTTILLFVLVKNEADIEKYTLLMIGGIFLSQLVVWPSALKHVRLVRIHFGDVLPHFKPVLVLFIPTIAVSLYKVMDKILLGAIGNTTQVGFFESSEKVIAIPLCIINSLGTVMLPRMANMLKSETSQSYRATVEGSAIFAAFITAPMVAGLMSVTHEFVPIFYGDGFDLCASLLCILLPSCVFIALANVIRTQILIPQGRDSVFITSCIAGAVVNLLLNVLTIPKWGAVGSAVSTLITEIVVCLYQAFMVRNDINMKLIITQYLIAVTMSAIMGGIVLLVGYLPTTAPIVLILKILIGLVVYGILLLLYYRKARSSGLLANKGIKL